MKLLLTIIKERRKIFSLLAVLLLADVILFAAILFFQRPRLETLQVTWFEKRRLQKGGDSRSLATVYQEGQADLAKFQDHIPAKREYTRLLGDLLELAENNELSAGGVTYKPSPVKGEKLVIYKLNMDVKGKYAGIKSFIADIQQLPQIITIDNMGLNSEGLTEETVDMRFQLSIYLKGEGP